MAREMLENALLQVIKLIIIQLELRLCDFKEGGFLPPDKRGLYYFTQKPIGYLILKVADFPTLNKHLKLRKKLLTLSNVLKNTSGLLNVYLYQCYKVEKRTHKNFSANVPEK